MERGGEFNYEAWCDECAKVTPHLHGECLMCRPLGYPRRPREERDAHAHVD